MLARCLTYATAAAAAMAATTMVSSSTLLAGVTVFDSGSLQLTNFSFVGAGAWTVNLPQVRAAAGVPSLVSA
jgi:hypothetical protein